MLKAMLGQRRSVVEVTIQGAPGGMDPVKADLIGEIQEHNAGVSAVYLERFDAEALRGYLEHLRCAARPRGRGAAWVRPTVEPAAAMADCAD